MADDAMDKVYDAIARLSGTVVCRQTGYPCRLGCSSLNTTCARPRLLSIHPSPAFGALLRWQGLPVSPEGLKAAAHSRLTTVHTVARSIEQIEELLKDLEEIDVDREWCPIEVERQLRTIVEG